MNSFDTLQSISSRLSELTNQLSTSKLSKEELEEFEALSRKIYERAVILNYKAKEEEVYGKISDKKVNPVLPFSNDKEEVEIEEDKKPLSENYLEAIVNEHEIVEEEEDFQEEIQEEAEEELLDNSEEETSEKVIVVEDGRVQFDFSGGFETPKTKEKAVIISDLINEEDEESVEKVVTEIETTQAELINEVSAKEEDEKPIAQEEKTIVSHAPKPSLNEVLQSKENVANDKTTSFYERFSKAYKAAVGDRLGTSKINSLKGAIGLNDRMLFINELFNGDSGSFNEAIDNLDQLENNEVALRKLSEIAAKENWNNEDASVDEFAHLITRRYVD